MKTILISVTATALLLGAGIVHADTGEASTSREEIIGFGSGAVIGAAAGGPLGFVIGSAVGALLGDTLHEKTQAAETLGAALAQAESEAEQLGVRYRRLASSHEQIDGELRRLKPLARPGLIEMMQAGIAMDLLFRTDESVLAPDTDGRLDELGALLAGMQDVRVQLDGFADERGDEDYNQQLSEQRVSYVRERLVAAGVPAERISTSAHGESAAIDESADSLALERRVTLKLFLDGTTSLAAHTPDDSL